MLNDSIPHPLVARGNFWRSLPSGVVVVIIILAGGIIIAILIRIFVGRLLSALGFNRFCDRTGISELFRKGGVNTPGTTGGAGRLLDYPARCGALEFANCGRPSARHLAGLVRKGTSDDSHHFRYCHPRLCRDCVYHQSGDNHRSERGVCPC